MTHIKSLHTAIPMIQMIITIAISNDPQRTHEYTNSSVRRHFASFIAIYESFSYISIIIDWWESSYSFDSFVQLCENRSRTYSVISESVSSSI